MAPIQPEDVSDDDLSSSQEVSLDGEEIDAAARDASKLLNHVSEANAINDMEEEYHTEDSDASGMEEGDQDSEDEVQELEGEDEELEVNASEPPLLPQQLLKPLPSPAYSVRNAVTIPWDQMTRHQKRAERNRSRKARKRAWEGLRQQAKENGVLDAGRAAQLKRGIASSGHRIRSGRIEKKSKPLLSGREKLLEERKRLIEREGSDLMRPSKKAKTQPRR